MIETLRSDLRFALRQIVRSPAVAALVVVTLAIGIGANTALFTMANAVFTRPLPGVRGSDRLVWITPYSERGGNPTNLAYPDFQDYRAVPAFQDAATFGNLRLAVRSSGDPEQVRGQIVSAGFFQVLGTRMAVGRGFLPEEDSTPGAHPVTVLAYSYWQQRFGGAPTVIGRPVTINGAQFTIVGVAERDFNGPAHAEPFALWVPISMANRAWPLNPGALTSRGTWWLEAVGRLRDGVPLAEASSALATVASRIARADTATHAGISARAQAMRSGLRPGDMNDIYPVATLASIVTVLVLLIACANVSNVLLSRALARQREIAVRLSIGASRGRLVRQLLSECGVLALVATVAGALLALWATDLVAAQIPAPLDVSIDQRVLAFALLAAVLTTLLFGLVPALHATRRDASEALRGAAAAGHDSRRSRLQAGFVVAQVALSLVLLSTAGLFLSSVREATRVDVGFDASRRVLAMSFDMGMQGYPADRTANFVRELDARARSLAGVERLALTSTVPMGERNTLIVPWLEAARPGGGTRPVERREIETYFHVVTPGYFQTLDLPLVRGRDFAASDDAGGAPVAIVSERFAREAWGGTDPIGKRLRTSESGKPMTVVGVAKDALLAGTSERVRAQLYVAWAQNPETRDLTLLVRARGDAAGFARPLRDVFRSLDPAMPITGVQTLAQYRWDRLAESRLGSRMLSIFGAIALLLASVGVYAVIAFSVAQRTREIGVRVALGAIQRQVVGLFVREGLRLTLAGVVIGLALALALAKVLSASFFGVSPADALALGSVSALLITVSLTACWLPARRAARVDPMQALRSE